MFKSRLKKSAKFFEEFFLESCVTCLISSTTRHPLTRAPLQLIHSVNNDDDDKDDYLDYIPITNYTLGQQ